jgi:hypothetical protein
LLAEEALRFKAPADLLPPGTERELLLRRIRQAETAAHIDDLLSSPELKPLLSYRFSRATIASRQLTRRRIVSRR